MSSQIIFSLFINDLISNLKSEYDRGIFVTDQIEDMTALMFADDVASFSETVIRLQHQVNCIQRFFESVGISSKLLKTKIIVFRNGGILKRMEKWLGKLLILYLFISTWGIFYSETGLGKDQRRTGTPSEQSSL